MLDYVTINIPQGDPNEPEEPRERFAYNLDKIYAKSSGEFCTDETVYAIRFEIMALCLSYLNEGIFPLDLWEHDHLIESSHHLGRVNIGFPIWLIYWLETGEFLPVTELKKTKLPDWLQSVLGKAVDEEV